MAGKKIEPIPELNCFESWSKTGTPPNTMATTSERNLSLQSKSSKSQPMDSNRDTSSSSIRRPRYDRLNKNRDRIDDPLKEKTNNNRVDNVNTQARTTKDQKDENSKSRLQRKSKNL